MSAPVLIVGCGDLGTEAGLRFAAAGHRVTGWRRNPSVLPPDLHGQAADVTRPSSLPAVDPRTGVVVIALTPGSRDADGYRSTFVDGTRAALAAVDAAGARPRVLFVSSTSVVGVDDGRQVDESFSGPPASATAAMLAEAERLVLSRPDAVVLRLAGVYGPGRTRLIDRVRAGSRGGAEHWTNRIHRDDAAAALVHLASLAGPAPLYHGVDDEPALEADVLTYIAGGLGLSPGESGSADGSPASVVASASGKAASGKRLPNRLLRSTGWTPAYPSYRDGYRALIAGVGTRHP